MTDVGEIGAVLASRLEGEVRADAYTRHLFSADASMYAIEPRRGRLPARRRRRRRGDRARRARLGVPVLARGAGTSLAGQAVGRGIVLDTSRHMDAIVALDRRARRARVQPGVVQDDLNRAAAPHGLAFGAGHLDVEPGDARRHDRQQLVRQPLDRLRHARSTTCARSRSCSPTARRARVRAAGRGGERERARPRHARRRDPPRAAGDRRRHARGDRRATTRALAPGRRLPAGPRSREPRSTSRASSSARRARSSPSPRPRSASSQLPTARRSPSATSVGRRGRDRRRPATRWRSTPAAVELIDRTILSSRAKLEYAELATSEGEPSALLYVTFFGDSEAEARGRLDAARGRLARARPRLPHAARRDRGRAGAR